MDVNVIKSAANYQILAGGRQTFSSNAPTSPANGDLWFEPSAKYAQPWSWNSTLSRWFGQPVRYEGSADAIVAAQSGGLYNVRPVEFYGAGSATIGHILQRINAGIYLHPGATNNASNYWRFSVYRQDGVVGWSQLYEWQTNTILQDGTSSVMTAGTDRRVNEYPNSNIPWNTWNISVVPTAVGTPGTVTFRYVLSLLPTR